MSRGLRGTREEVKGNIYMKTPSILEMLQSGVHFGHQISRWHPKMKPYIYTDRGGVHVIDLEKTQVKLQETLEAARKLASEGKVILFATTKAQAREIVKQAAIDAGMPYLVERWLGGMLTNFTEIKKMIKRYNEQKAMQGTPEFEKYTKKEQTKISKDLVKMDKYMEGLVALERMPDVIFVPSLQAEKTAVTEANRMHVQVIGIADTNANPDKATYFVPANDDAVNSIKMMVGLIAEAIKEGKKEFEKNKAAQVNTANSMANRRMV